MGKGSVYIRKEWYEGPGEGEKERKRVHDDEGIKSAWRKGATRQAGSAIEFGIHLVMAKGKIESSFAAAVATCVKTPAPEARACRRDGRRQFRVGRVQSNRNVEL